MQIEGLLRKRKIYPHRATQGEINRVLQLADRDLRMARHIMAEDWDWAFSIAFVDTVKDRLAITDSEAVE
ncbi:MAG: hypothetical protein K8R59_05810 [Thermoanaerobaculales bacterium]|nr:hypothetical protein [Thermoanaerobaculales bacterium]